LPQLYPIKPNGVIRLLWNSKINSFPSTLDSTGSLDLINEAAAMVSGAGVEIKDTVKNNSKTAGL